MAFVNENISHFCHSGNYTLLSTEGTRLFFFDRGAVQVEETQTDYSCDFLQIAGNYAVVGQPGYPGAANPEAGVSPGGGAVLL